MNFAEALSNSSFKKVQSKLLGSQKEVIKLLWNHIGIVFISK